jgi:hypothetical protein
LLEKNKAYRSKNKEKLAENYKEYYLKNKEIVKEKNKKYYADNKEKIKDRNKESRKIYYSNIENRNKKKVYNDRYYKEHCGDMKKSKGKCPQCGVVFDAWSEKSKFCSKACSSKYRSGSKSPSWKGGISFEPYCPLFNKNLKMRVREFFDNQCVICSRSKEENDNKNLSVHHVEYNKNACCDGKRVHFAALCGKCHSKTNHDRERWEAMLHRIIDEIYDGKSYYGKEEWDYICQEVG